MPRGGKREGAGRKVGSKSKKTQEVIAKAQAGGLMPVDYMLQVMRDEEVPRAERLDAATIRVANDNRIIQVAA